MKHKKTSSTRKKNQTNELSNLRKVISEQNETIAKIKQQLHPTTAVAKDPVVSIQETLRSHAPLDQNGIIEDVVVQLAVERIKELENAEANLRIASDRLEDFMKRYPGVVNYRPSLKSN